MYFLDEIPNNVVKRKEVLLPINDDNRKKGSAIILLTPNYKSSIGIMNHNLIKNRYYNSYFLRRTALYYIDGTKEEPVQESSNILLEDYEKLFKQLSIDMIYNGLENDIREVTDVIDEGFISDLKKSLPTCIRFPKHIKCEVYRDGTLREPSVDTFFIQSRYSYNRNIFKDYETFCRFNFLVFLLKNNNPNINKSLLYSICLIESGLYDICIKNNHWSFNDDLKALCNSIKKYINAKSKYTFYKEIILKNNNVKELVRLLSTFLDINSPINNILDMFHIDTIYEEFTYSDTINVPENYIAESLNAVPVTDSEYMLLEDTKYNSIIKKLLYKDRLKTLNDLKDIYAKIKEDYTLIKYTYPTLDRYKGLNIFFDTYFYNELYIKNSIYKNIRGYDIYSDFMDRLILDPELATNGYTNNTVIIPVQDWYKGTGKIYMIQDGINPISCIYKRIISNKESLNKYGNMTFMFLGEKSYFTINFAKDDITKIKGNFIRNINLILDKNAIIQDDESDKESSPKVIKDDIINKVEKTQNIEIPSLNKENIKPNDKALDKKSEELKVEKKKTLVDKIDQVSKVSTDIDIALDKLDDDEMKDILDFLADNPDDGVQVSSARKSRSLKLKNDLLSKEIKGKTIKDILEPAEDIPDFETDMSVFEEPIELNIDSVNEEWKELRFPLVDETYNMDDDIIRTFESLSRLSNPLYIRDISVENNSTSEDAIETYTVKYESAKGERFTIKLGIPIFIDNKYIKLRGNRKELPNQLFLMPVIKTDEDTVQIVSNYKKIFIRTFGSSVGKSISNCSRLIKTLTKHTYPNVKIVDGMNRRICSKYELPIDYIDLSRTFTRITAKDYIFYFNQDEIRKKYDIDEKQGIPIGYDTKNKKVLYYNSNNGILSEYIALLISTQLEGTTFYNDYNKAAKPTKCAYSRASIMGTKIPLIVLCAYSEGLDKVLRKAGIKYDLTEEKPKDLPYNWDIIRFEDGYLSYELDYDSSLLLNGLKECPVRETSIADLNKKITYINYLDLFGGRIIADGLDNFYDLMIDTDTYNKLRSYKLPTDYISLLLYANQLLADNKFVKHTNIAGTRQLKRKQQIVDLLYEVLSRAYSDYSTSLKHGRSKGFSIKETAVIDEFMKLNTSSDLSIINPVGEYESYNSVTPKGHSGMNSDRSYGLDKRSYDESMRDVLAVSTGFASTVGITRQATIDANVDKYGRIHAVDAKELNPVKSLCMTEALTPFGTTNEDPIRTAMNFIQTSKHSMRCKDSDPLLVTTGADEALPYLVSNTFSYKTKDKGKVVEKTNEYMILEYDNGEHEFISLIGSIEKNSSNGFYIDIKLKSDLKVGDKFNKNDIVAYDDLAYSDKTGTSSNIEYNIGPLVKIAILNTDEGYEDSAIISDKLSEKMASEVILPVTKSIPKEANIYNMVKEGQKVKEGDTLFTIQAATDDEYVDQVMRNLTTSDGIINELGRTSIKASITGVIEKIVIKRTCEKNELSDTLLKVVNKYEANINKMKNVMKKYNIDTSMVPSTDKLENQGKLKKVDGVYIEIYIKYNDKMSVGDKMIYYSAVKGVIKDIFPKGKEPYSDYRKNEKIDSLLSLGSVNARMVMSGIKIGSINKILIEASRHCKDILGIEYDLDL